jgi:hypothetical protein
MSVPARKAFARPETSRPGEIVCISSGRRWQNDPRRFTMTRSGPPAEHAPTGDGNAVEPTNSAQTCARVLPFRYTLAQRISVVKTSARNLLAAMRPGPLTALWTSIAARFGALRATKISNSCAERPQIHQQNLRG